MGAGVGMRWPLLWEGPVHTLHTPGPSAGPPTELQTEKGLAPPAPSHQPQPPGDFLRPTHRELWARFLFVPREREAG